MKRISLLTSFFTLVILLSSCTYNISMAHTEGQAEDVIDDTQSNTPNISPTLNGPSAPWDIAK